MSKYTKTAHDKRRDHIQTLREIMQASPAAIDSNLPVAKTIGRLFSHMPNKKRDFVSLNSDVAYLLQHKVTKLVAEDIRITWIDTCKSLIG